jgi:hypothetical protein
VQEEEAVAETRKCAYCRAETSLFISNTPICLECEKKRGLWDIIEEELQKQNDEHRSGVDQNLKT